MDWDRLFDWLDNPILVKHVRSRLRCQPVVSSLVVIQTLCLCVLWAGFQLNIFITGGAFELLVLLQAIILIVMGSSQVSSAVNGAPGYGRPGLPSRLAAFSHRVDSGFLFRTRRSASTYFLRARFPTRPSAWRSAPPLFAGWSRW